jgi:hypothetical protein
VTVKGFIMEDGRDAQPRLFDQEPLDGVGKECGLARIFSLSLPGDLPDPIF